MTDPSTWGLRRAPFESGPAPELFYPSEDHLEALARLEYLSRERGAQLGLVTGEIGCGKTMTRTVFSRQSADKRLVAQLTSSHYPFPAILRSVLGQLGVADPGPGAAEFDLVSCLQEFLVSKRWPATILLDEAQDLSHESLVGLRGLTNLFDGRLDLTVVLIGQPELRDLIRALPQLDQRAGLRYHLKPLPQEEVGSYLWYRLRASGHTGGDLFERDAADAIAAASCGVPREINRIARLAMSVASRRSASTIGERDVRVVTRDLARQRGASV